MVSTDSTVILTLDELRQLSKRWRGHAELPEQLEALALEIDREPPAEGQSRQAFFGDPHNPKLRDGKFG